MPTLRVVGSTQELSGFTTSVQLAEDPLELAMSLLADHGITIPHQMMSKVGEQTPEGRSFPVAHVDRAVAALDAALAALDPDEDREHEDLDALRGALKVFRTAKKHGRTALLTK